MPARLKADSVITKPAGSMIRQVRPKQAHIRRMVAALGAMSG